MRRVTSAGLYLIAVLAAGLVTSCNDGPTEVPTRDLGNPTVALATADNGAGMSITTDKDDYSPGDTVQFIGAGWPANDVLGIVLSDDAGDVHEWTINVEADGTFRDSTYVVDTNDLGVTFTLTATSRATGESLTVTFTDAELVTAELTAPVNDVTVTQGTSANFTISLTATGAIKCAATALNPATAKVHTVFAISAGGVVSSNTLSAAFNFFGGTPLGGPNCTVTWTGVPTAYSASASVSAAATTPIGDYVITLNPGSGKVVLTNPAGPGGNLADDVATTITVHVVGASNHPPTVDAEKDADPNEYSGNEGSAVSLNGDASDADSDPLTISWTYAAVSGVDAGATCSFSDASSLTSTVTCTDDGEYQLTLSAQETGTGNPAVTSTARLTIANVAPTVVVSPTSKTIDEGSTASFTATVTDPGSNDDPSTFTYAWTTTVGSCSLSTSTLTSATFACNDDGTGKVKLTVNDGDANGEGSGEADLTVNNVPPTITTLTLPVDPVSVGTPVSLSATFTDPGSQDTHTAQIDWDDLSSSAGTIGGSNTSGTVSATHTYTTAGIYAVGLTVTDKDGGSDTEVFQYVVVYDPSAGFVTGGGWINSPAIACPDYCGGATGRANFGFVSKYLKGANVPTGNTEFQFQAGNLNFSSTSYQWLVVQGTNKATYKGQGTINGGGSYKFLLYAFDGGSTGDQFRIKIWLEDGSGNETVIYDNQYGAAIDAGVGTAIAGGSIVIHTSKK